MKKVKQIVESTGNLIDQKVELAVVDPTFKGCKFYYDGLKFAEGENEDGSKSMNFEYTITNGYEIPEDRQTEFNIFLGDLLILILEEQLAKGEVVYSGGV